MALLHMLHGLGTHQLIVAHVDHGIRQDSIEDALLVQAVADNYNLPFELVTHSLGSDASEDRARHVRYDFLKTLADKHAAQIVTAHHADDIVETVAINLHRGTGWRGLATHDADVVRPLLAFSKEQLYDYALRHRLEWREDSTNSSDAYLRNRIRKRVQDVKDDIRQPLLRLRTQQLETKKQIQQEVRQLLGKGPDYDRYFFTHITGSVAVECLRQVTDGKMTRPQLERFLLAIKTAKPGKTIELGNGLRAHFTTRNFHLSLIK